MGHENKCIKTEVQLEIFKIYFVHKAMLGMDQIFGAHLHNPFLNHLLANTFSSNMQTVWILSGTNIWVKKISFVKLRGHNLEITSKDNAISIQSLLFLVPLMH